MDLWAGHMDQVVEQLPSKCKALSSSPSTLKKKYNRFYLLLGYIVGWVFAKSFTWRGKKENDKSGGFVILDEKDLEFPSQ
jgi:hypothetical protein